MTLNEFDLTSIEFTTISKNRTFWKIILKKHIYVNKFFFNFKIIGIQIWQITPNFTKICNPPHPIKPSSRWWRTLNLSYLLLFFNKKNNCCIFVVMEAPSFSLPPIAEHSIVHEAKHNQALFGIIVAFWELLGSPSSQKAALKKS